MNKKITTSLLFINEWLKKQDNTDETKLFGNELINLEEGIAKLLDEKNDLEQENSQLEYDLREANDKNEIEDLYGQISELEKRPEIEPKVINDELKIKIIGNLYENLSLDQLEKIEQEAIKAFEQEGKTYLTF